MTIMYRQGDVLLRMVSVRDADVEPSDVHESVHGFLLAEGETSQHGHFVTGSGVRLCRYKATPGTLVVVADAGGEVRVVGGGAGGVDRHTPIALAPGRYSVRIQRSYADGYSRRVED